MSSALDRSITTPAACVPRAGRVAVLLRILHAVRHPRQGTQPLGPRRIATHFLRCAVQLSTFRDWFGHPAQTALRRELAARPQLLTCVVHPYLNSGWTARRKLAVIGAHYGLLSGRLALLAAESPAPLADVGEGLRIHLARPGRFEHEGEATIQLLRGDEELYTLAFTLGQLGAQRIAYIGALQGQHSRGALDIYRELTHRLHGLRPRDLMVTAFRQFCQSIGVTRILAVGDARRVSSNAYFTSSARVYASYDEVWKDNGGAAADEGFFEFGAEPSRRDAAAVPARKRALYRRRYELLDRLASQIEAAVQAGAARVIVD